LNCKYKNNFRKKNKKFEYILKNNSFALILFSSDAFEEADE